MTIQPSDQPSLTVPADLAEVLEADGLVAIEPPDMSALPGLIEAGATIAATVITLAQAPVTVAQLIDALRSWRVRRKGRGIRTGRICIRDGAGTRIGVNLDDDVDLVTAAKAIDELLRARRPSSRPVSDSFDDE